MSVISHNCPTCGSILNFDIDTQNWKCKHCKKKFEISELKKYIDSKKEYDGYNCENCGAEIVTYEDVLTTTCAYCGSPAIIRGKISGEYKPDFIVPFKYNTEAVINSFLNQKKRKSLCPKSFFDIGNIKQVHGIYVPYWLFSCEVVTSVSGVCRDNRNREMYIKRKASMLVDRIPADAKTKMDNEFLGGIEPFDYTEMKPFEYSYLAGFCAEKYDENIDSAFEDQIQERIFEATLNKMKMKDGIFYNIDEMKKEAHVHERKAEYVLMPVWCLHIEYKGVEYKYYVNDQNLVVSGKYPISFVQEIFLWMLLWIMVGLTAYVALTSLYKQETVMLALITAGAWTLISRTINSYNHIKRGVKNIEYIQPKSFKFLEYKDETINKKVDFEREKDDK